MCALHVQGHTCPVVLTLEGCCFVCSEANDYRRCENSKTKARFHIYEFSGLVRASFHDSLEKQHAVKGASIRALQQSIYTDSFPNSKNRREQALVKKKIRGISTRLHHITSLFYHPIPLNDTSGIAPAFSKTVEGPSSQWEKAWQRRQQHKCLSSNQWMSAANTPGIFVTHFL